MKKTISLLLVLTLFTLFSLTAAGAVSGAPTPGEDASLRFSVKLGTGYRNAPTPPAVQNGCLYTVAGAFIWKLDALTGEILRRQALESVSTYTAVPPTVEDGVVYMPLDDGIVEAFDADTLTPLWSYADALGGQGLSPVTVDGDFLYTAFWNGETNEANFVCLPRSGSGAQRAVWTYMKAGGFYRAAPLVVGDRVLVASDNGERVDQPDAPGAVLCFDKKSGRLLSSLPLPGDIRAGIARDETTGALYTATKAGLVVRMALDGRGVLSETGRYNAGGGVSLTPVVFAGSVYAAAQNGRAGRFFALTADTLTERWSADMPGVPQGDLLLNTALWDDWKTVRVYATYNAPPGGVWMFEDVPGRTEAVSAVVFDPPAESAQYCFCPVVGGEDGTIYYKNDSGTVFALAPAASLTAFQGANTRLVRLVKLLQAFLRLFAAVGRQTV